MQVLTLELSGALRLGLTPPMLDWFRATHAVGMVTIKPKPVGPSFADFLAAIVSPIGAFGGPVELPSVQYWEYPGTKF
jgi:hypothetical protein